MATPFIGEIIIFAGTFPPAGYAFCDGQTLAISQNTALFSLIGTTYGGDGEFTFALPNLQSRAPVHFGQGNGLTAYNVGDKTGVESVALTTSQIPTHTHALEASIAGSTSRSPEGNALAMPAHNIYDDNISLRPVSMAGGAIGSTGDNQPHENRQPYLALNFCIALVGDFPPQS